MDTPIDINLADATELTQLPGVGAALAARIIAYRQEVHPFEEVIELTAVPGISERMVREWQAQLTVQTPVAETALEQDVDRNEPIETTAVHEPLEMDEAPEAPASEPEALLELVEAPDTEPPAPSSLEDALQDQIGALPEPEPAAEPERIELDSKPEPETMADRISVPVGMTPPATEPDMTSNMTSSQTVPPSSELLNNDVISRQRGCLFVLIGTVAGAILGMALTLAVLSALNSGSLLYTQASQQLRSQLEQTNDRLDTLNASLDQADARLNDMATRDAALDEGQATLSDSVDSINQTVNSTQSELTTVQEDVADLIDTAEELDTRLESVAASAETFDAFLNGMRELLGSLPEGAATETAAPTASATPEPVTPTAEATASQAGTSTPRPTRTPRPTATPITLPTSTPGQQP